MPIATRNRLEIDRKGAKWKSYRAIVEVFSIGIGPVRNRWPEVHAYVSANGLYTTVEQISVLTGQIWTVGVYTKLRVRAEGSKGQSDRRCMAIVSQFNHSVHLLEIYCNSIGK